MVDKSCLDCGIVMYGAKADKLRCAGCNRKYRTKTQLIYSRAKGILPRGVPRTNIICNCCGSKFKSERRTRRWCDKCRTLGGTARATMTFPRACQWCGASWVIKRGDRSVSNKRYCSEECRRSAAVESRLQSKQRDRDGTTDHSKGRPPSRPKGFSRAFSRGSIQTRFFLLNPDRPKKCEACEESRVVELAHKIPRRSAWRKVPKTFEIWVLCPTCHRCLDSGIETKASLGLL